VKSLWKSMAPSLVLMCSVPATAADDPPHVQVLSATVRDQKIPGATVILQRNGQQSRAATTNAGGRATVDPSIADDPAALIIVRKEGYSDLVAKCPCTGLTYAVSPILSRLDELRIVLSWGRNPEDLDAHLAFDDSHVFFDNKTGESAQLDVDQMTGSRSRAGTWVHATSSACRTTRTRQRRSTAVYPPAARRYSSM
jgi:hypothetical protein